MMNEFSVVVNIESSPARVWLTLTDNDLMKQWMGEPDMEIQIETDWKVNTPFVVRGFHHVKFENKGIVLESDPGKKLSYTHVSSISRLPDKVENYSIIEFTLAPENKGTMLTLQIRNFPTESIRKHLEFYWNTTIFLIKDIAESSQLS